jgi:phenylalanyl-tRNA synthetase beta chain
MVEVLQSVFWKKKRDGSIEQYQSINNVVDATNYVLMECGQPLHAFDYAKVKGSKIVIRPGHKGEKIKAIDHRDYELDESMCVIADESDASAVAGVMGGADSEVDEATTDLVIEAAVFTPLSVRRTARRLKLHSPSSFRFERKVDPVGVDWASRRVCDLIVEMAGGSVASGVIDTAPEIPSRPPVVLRASQLERILGFKIDSADVSRILTQLGCQESDVSSDGAKYVPPSWRHDLTREADLIEEVARIHGYDKIPEDAPIPVAPSSRRRFDTAIDRVRLVMTSAGLSESMTPSVVTKTLDQALSPWTELPCLTTQTPMLEGAKELRRTLLPSLLQARARNWSSASIAADLFEIAHIYVPNKEGSLPSEQYSLGIVSGSDFFELKGTLETLVARMGIDSRLDAEAIERAGFAVGSGVELKVDGDVIGYLGMVDEKLLKSWKMPGPVVVAELSLPTLLEKAKLVPQQKAISTYPSIQRDLNFVVAESVRWSEMENVVSAAVGADLAGVTYRETYRDAKKDGNDHKRVLMSVELQRHDATLSGQQADELVNKVIDACGKQLSAKLLM